MKIISRLLPVDDLANGVHDVVRLVGSGLSTLPRLETALLIGLVVLVRA